MEFQRSDTITEADYKGQAVRELVGSPFHMTADHEIVYLGGQTPPTTEEIDAKIVELKEEYLATQYQRDRQYPSIGDQLDMQYHDELNGTTTWKDAVAKVKADNPKPE